jgi:hypothetical protein
MFALDRGDQNILSAERTPLHPFEASHLVHVIDLPAFAPSPILYSVCPVAVPMDASRGLPNNPGMSAAYPTLSGSYPSSPKAIVPGKSSPYAVALRLPVTVVVAHPSYARNGCA